jgi:UDP-N-acetylmuramyl pentapeptide phosphotransferase/UDP-N-acetylglucosamine-1-phosphate transferase
MPTGSAALPWWVDALLILMAVVIVITLIVLVTEMIRNIGAGKKSEPGPADHSQLAVPSANGSDQV